MPPAAEGFARKRHRLFMPRQAPGHSAQDVVVAVGDSATLEGKFAYGDLSKDLEQEKVRVFLETCAGWSELGDATTDDDGRTRLTLAAAALPGAGRYRVAHVVRGDASVVFSELYIVPRGTRVVVFDIDGTLTTGDDEIIEQILDPSDFPDAVTGAAELTQRWAELGYLVVYLTGRPYWLMPHTREWLEREGFAPGSVRTADRHRDVVPGDRGVGDFKLAFLQELQSSRGLIVEAAYGNASTDVYAYTSLGLDTARIFIRGKHGGRDGTVDAGDDWRDELEALREASPAQQPWHAQNTDEADR